MNHEQDTPLGIRLRRLREGLGLTQEELARRAGLSAKAISALERGERRRPYPHTLRALASALGLSEEERAALLASVPTRGRKRQGDTAATLPADAAGADAAETDAGSPAQELVSTALPSVPTPLVGREREVEEIAGLLHREGASLITLTGPGGVGKTRLAIQVAQSSAELFPDGVAFVALAPLSDPELVVPTIFQNLRLRETGEEVPLREALQAHLRHKSLLLVLDNFEHLMEAAPEVSELLKTSSNLKVLVTSRAPLRLRGEQEYPVPPLAVPTPTRILGTQEVLKAPAVELFVERAREASPAFSLTQHNAATVAAICWRLEGLPLALELAAARLRFLGPTTLLSRLDRALQAEGARDLPERQRTMRATLEWSHELLSKEEKVLFRRLSVFAGGFTLEAAEEVGAAEDIDLEEIVELLGRLAEQSLVVAEVAGADDEEERYRMLEPVRRYALERLKESGEAEETQQRHAAFFLDLAEQAESELRGPRQVEWLERLERESGNLRAAMSWALSTGDYDTAARLGWGQHSFWWLRGYHREGRSWMEAALEHELPPALRARALHAAATATFAQGDYPAAEERWREALHLSRREEDILAEGNALAGMGLVGMVHSDHEAASSSMVEAIALFERYEEDYLVSVLRVFLGTTLLGQGESEQSERMFEEALASSRRLEIPSLTYIVLYNSAQLALAQGDHEKATSMLAEGIEWSERTKDRANLAHFMEALSAVAALWGEAERSAVLIGAAEGLLREVGAPVYNFYRPDPSLRERAVAEARAALGEAAFEAAWEQGRAMTFEQAVEYALKRDETPPSTSL